MSVLEITDSKTILETYEKIRKNPSIKAWKEKYGVALIGYTVSYIPRLSFATSGYLEGFLEYKHLKNKIKISTAFGLFKFYLRNTDIVLF